MPCHTYFAIQQDRHSFCTSSPFSYSVSISFEFSYYRHVDLTLKYSYNCKHIPLGITLSSNWPPILRLFLFVPDSSAGGNSLMVHFINLVQNHLYFSELSLILSMSVEDES